ncbi:hypothetical protein MalM25_04120 [Planctomycetes bacterium MalM25]|nr:hypothetical protein MalM25_04120 [Planctomycetes bacterium MalM25]
MHRPLLHATLAFAAVALSSPALAQSPAFQQQVPQQAVGQPIPNGGQVARQMMSAHRSNRLKAEFTLQWMQIPNFSFWGARITSMDQDSPLRQIGLQLGDVVTRLDGTRVSTGKWWDQSRGVWALPQMERHFGRTQIRNIRSGTTLVRNEYADLGPRWQVPSPYPGGGGGTPIIVP